MKKIMTALALITALIILCAAAAFGAETSYIVNLHKKIKADQAELKRVQQDTDVKIKQINKEIVGLVERIESSDSEAEREILVNKYYKFRSQELYHRVWIMNQAEGTFSRITENMRQLESAMGETNRNEDGSMMTKADLPAIDGTLRGLADLIRPLQMLKSENPRINYLARTLQNLDSRYGALMDNPQRVTLVEQIAYMEDPHAFISSMQQVAEQERMYLLTKVYTLIGDSVLKVVNEAGGIGDSLLPSSNNSEKNQQQARVERARKTSFQRGKVVSQEVSLDSIGHHGGGR